MRLPPYSAYKPSGVEWLGEVPAHWEARRLRNVADIRFSNVDKHSKEGEKAVRLCNYTDVYHNDRIHSEMDFMRATATDDEIGRFQLAVGDVLITKDSESWNDIGVPALVESTDTDLVCGYHLALVRPNTKKIDGKFLSAALSCPNVAVQLHVCANGVTRFGLSQNSIKSAWLPRPPLPEQTAIARFLDHATDQIERYIRAKEKLIALLEEQKQVMIHDAVTGRIDVRTGKPYPAYKPSGAEWLGNVPALWKVRKLRQCVKIVGGMTPRMEERRFWDGRIPWVTPKDMKREIVSDSSVRVSKAALSDTTLRLINPPVVLMVVRGMILARKIPIAWTSQPVTINQDMKALIPTSDMYAAFLARTLTAAQDTIALWVDVAGHGTRRLPTECWRELIVPIPPIAEQTAILDFIETEITRINDANKCARREIKLLREYRTRLIADVVTGKLDVCEAAANLPKLEAIADGGDETIPAEPDSQQSNITLHNEAPPTTPGASS